MKALGILSISTLYIHIVGKLYFNSNIEVKIQIIISHKNKMESLKILAMREHIKNVIHEEGYEIIEKRELDSVVEVARFLKQDYLQIQNNVRHLIQKVDLVEHKLNLLLAHNDIRNKPIDGERRFPRAPRGPIRYHNLPRPPP